MTIVFWRCVFGATFMLLWCVALRYLPDRSLSIRSLVLSAMGGSCLVLSWAAFFAGLEMTSIATATIVMHVQPFIIVLISAFFLKERLTSDQVLWIVAAFIGLIFASGVGAGVGLVDRTWLLGIGITLIGAVCYALTAMIGKQLANQRPEVTALCQTVMGILIFLPFIDLHQTITLPSWGWLAAIGIIHSGIAWVIIYSALPKVPTPVVAILSFVYPIVAICIDWAIYDHPLGLLQAGGMIVIGIATLGVRLGWRLGGKRRSVSSGY
ncbi:DMT family transporter [Rhizobium sp. AAP43]|uniref:DMT family transporter n=1 Tax=Rhizobium sp. AAP43 TaxID=1523420 RepID=UPI001FD894ED|nr:DMT family transporter [Rhizobium sp. AAP43]